jgi:hypothetical protein
MEEPRLVELSLRQLTSPWLQYKASLYTKY